MSNRAELERLWEGRVLDSVDLSRAEAAALNASQLVSVQPGPSGWRITAGYVVGAVRVGELTVRVRPKVGTLQVLRLLARAYGVRGLILDDSSVGIDVDDDLTAALAVLFAQEASSALALGPLRGYRTEDQSLSVVRGRIRLRDQELRRFGQVVPIEVTVDEWTTDTDENRLIRAAARRLMTLPAVPAHAMAGLQRLDRLLADVTLPVPGAILPRWTATRLNVRLHRLLGLADVVLQNSTLEHRPGAVVASGFVVRMEWLFETLIARLLAEKDGTLRTLAQSTYQLDDLGLLTIKPDLVLVDGATAVAVGDTKYKILGPDGKVPTPDAYQMVTYCRRLGLATGHLIYAGGVDANEAAIPKRLDVINAGVTIVLHRVDLAQSIGAIEGDAGRVRRALAAERVPIDGTFDSIHRASA